MRLPRRGVLLGTFLLAGGPAEPVAELPGYRMHDYKAPTPATLAGARVLSTAQARALWENKAAVFVDVMPQPPRPSGLPAGTLWQPKVRRDIPGSLWLPDVGYGALAAPMAAYFARNLRPLRGRPLVFYCLASCWHSWNAAKRALALGYTMVAWYPGGTDAWEAAGLPLAANTPAPRPDVTEEIR